MAVGLKIELEEIDRNIVLRIDGRLDATSSPILDRKLGQLIDENHSHLVLDFSKVHYLSSAGMRVLLSATKKLKSKKGSLAVFALSDEVSEIIHLAGFDRVLHICSSEKEALQYAPRG